MPGQALNYLDAIAAMIRDEVPSRALPPTKGTESLFRIYAVLLQAKGSQVSSQDVHNAWVAWMAGRDDDHSALVAYEELPEDVAREDDVYVAAIRRVATRLSETSLGKLEEQ